MRRSCSTSPRSQRLRRSGRLHWGRQSTLSGPPVKRRQCKLARIRQTATFRQHRWTMAAPYEAEITFLSGVGADNLVAPVSFGIGAFRRVALPSLRSNIPHFPDIFKWGNSRPGTSGRDQLPVRSGVRLDVRRADGLQGRDGSVGGGRQRPDPGGRPADQADFQIVRATDGRAVWDNVEPYTYPPIGSPTLAHCRAATPGTTSRSTPLTYRRTSPASRPKGFRHDDAGSRAWPHAGLGHGGPYDFNVDTTVQQFGPYDMRLWTLMSYIRPDESAFHASQYPVTGTQWDGYYPLHADDDRHFGGAAPVRRGDQRPAHRRRPHLRLQQQHPGRDRQLLQLQRQQASDRHDLGERPQQHARPVGLLDELVRSTSIPAPSPAPTG